MLPEIIVKKIKFEISEIDTEISTYKPLLDLCKIKNPDIVEITASASVLHSFYSGIENIFILIAKNIDKNIPKGEKWHNELLKQMNKKNDFRKPVIIGDTFNILKEYLLYRHYFRHSYSWRLEWDEFKNLIFNLNDTWLNLKKELFKIIKI